MLRPYKTDPYIRGYSNYILLGSGSYGKVYKAYSTIHQKDVSVKFFDKRKPGAREDYNNELNAYKVLSTHPNCDPYIVCVYDHGSTRDSYYIVQELMSGNLTDFTGSGGFPKYQITDPLSVLFIFYQLSEGLRHIHESGMAHRDIKPENLLYKAPEYFKNGRLFFNNPKNIAYEICFKYGDLGLTCTKDLEKLEPHYIKNPNSKYSRTCTNKRSNQVPPISEVANCYPQTTLNYSSPEFIRSLNKFRRFYRSLTDNREKNRIKLNFQEYLDRYLEPEEQDAGIWFYQSADIWALGLVFFNFIYGYYSVDPFHEFRNQSEIDNFLRVKRVKSKDPDFNIAINHLLKSILKYNFQERPRIEEISNYINETIKTYIDKNPDRPRSVRRLEFKPDDLYKEPKSKFRPISRLEPSKLSYYDDTEIEDSESIEYSRIKDIIPPIIEDPSIRRSKTRSFRERIFTPPIQPKFKRVREMGQEYERDLEYKFPGIGIASKRDRWAKEQKKRQLYRQLPQPIPTREYGIRKRMFMTDEELRREKEYNKRKIYERYRKESEEIQEEGRRLKERELRKRREDKKSRIIDMSEQFTISINGNNSEIDYYPNTTLEKILEDMGYYNLEYKNIIGKNKEGKGGVYLNPEYTLEENQIVPGDIVMVFI